MVYFQGHADKPFSVDCVGMAGSAPAATYLPLSEVYTSDPVIRDDQRPTYNYTTVGVLNNADTVYRFRTFQKYRLVSTGGAPAIDLNDISYSSAYPFGSSSENLDAVFRATAKWSATAAQANIDLTGTGLALRQDNVVAAHGSAWDKPTVKFHSYVDALNNVYVEGMTASAPHGYNSIDVENPTSPTRLWLQYVPQLATSNQGAGTNSGSKTVPVKTNPSDGGAKPSWCSTWTDEGLDCANPVLLISVKDLFNSP